MHILLGVLVGTVALLAVIAPAAPASRADWDACKDRIDRDTPYADARKTLLADGFLPARTGACSAPGREEICSAFPEAQMCAGTGFAECEFVFRRPDGATVRIVTRGEAVKDLTVYRVKRGRPGSSGRDRR